MSKPLGGIISCKDKTSSWHLNRFPDGSNIGSIIRIMSGRSPPLHCTLTLIAMQGHQTIKKNVVQYITISQAGVMTRGSRCRQEYQDEK